MPNRDGTWPQGQGKMTWKAMWACQSEWKQWLNVPLENWQWKRCGKWLRRWLGNRWNSIEEEKENVNNREE